MHSSKLLTDLPAELVSDISAHLPLVYRPTTLLSLALTCRHFHYIVVPRLLYRDVRLTGEKQALSFLNSSVSQLQSSNESNPPLSHYIHHLCIESIVELPLSEPKHSITMLHELLDLDGLPQLSALTLHLEDVEMDDASYADFEAAYPLIPPLLWKSLRARCPRLKKIFFDNPEFPLQAEVIEKNIFSQELTSIRVHCDCDSEVPESGSIIDFSGLQSSNLHTLDLHLCEIDILPPMNGSLLTCIFPNLHTLILNEFNLCGETNPVSTFWKNHLCIERLEIGELVFGDWFENFEAGMLPNLKYLRCDANTALILLPHVSKTLVGLGVFDTFGAQGTYLLRKVCPGGILPELRSLSIYRHTRMSANTQTGCEWLESVGVPGQEADLTSTFGEIPDALELFRKHNTTLQRPASTIFNESYIAHIAKAAPKLEELELTGTSDESLGSLTASLSLIPNLRRLNFSSPGSFVPFFMSSIKWKEYAGITKLLTLPLYPQDVSKYSPDSFVECVRDLANGCPTLETITTGDKAGQFLIRDGLSARIEREFERGPVKKVRKVKAWGYVVGREEEW